MVKLRILLFSANPEGTDVLRLDEELRAITQKVRAADYGNLVEIIVASAVRPDDLFQALNQYRPHVVQFSGHGNCGSEILVCDESGRPRPVSKEGLVALFDSVRDNVQVVVLNCCYSRAQAEAIVSVVPCAVGMGGRIGDHAALVFAAAFYRAIGFGRSVADAFRQGIAALEVENIPEGDVPQLLVREGVDPTRIVLVNPEPSAVQASAYRPWQKKRLGLYLAIVTICLVIMFLILAQQKAADPLAARRDEFAFDTYRTLFDQGDAAMSSLNASYDRIEKTLYENYGLGAHEADALKQDMEGSVRQLEEFSEEVKRLGNDEQVAAVHNIRECVMSDYSRLYRYASLAREASEMAGGLVQHKGAKGKAFKAHVEGYEKKLDELIEEENELFFFVTQYNQPVLDRLQQLFNMQFRNSLGLGSNDAIRKALAELPEVAGRRRTFKYEKKEHPYVVAETRRFLSANVAITDHTDFLKEKNEYLKQGLMLKYIASALGDDGKS